MKKVFFSILAVSLLFATAVEAKKKASKKQAARQECPASCPKSKGCAQMHS